MPHIPLPGRAALPRSLRTRQSAIFFAGAIHRNSPQFTSVIPDAKRGVWPIICSQVLEAEAFSFCRVFQENPELTGNIMEINDLREFGRLVFQTRLLPQENAKNTKTRGYANCCVFFCDLCALSRPFAFGRGFAPCSPKLNFPDFSFLKAVIGGKRRY